MNEYETGSLQLMLPEFFFSEYNGYHRRQESGAPTIYDEHYHEIETNTATPIRTAAKRNQGDA